MRVVDNSVEKLPHDHCLEVFTTKSSYHFAFDNEEEKVGWLAALTPICQGDSNTSSEVAMMMKEKKVLMMKADMQLKEQGKALKKMSKEEKAKQQEEYFKYLNVNGYKDCIMRGWCQKRKEKMGISRWKKRYLVLKEDSVYYLNSPEVS